MRIPRIFHPVALKTGTQISLTEDASHHVGRVLRMQVGQSLALFTGDDHRYDAIIRAINKKSVVVDVVNAHQDSCESPIDIHLVQGVSKGDRMEFVIQKSVELGVRSITPLFTERCNVKLSGDRLEKKHEQWSKIVYGACEQSGRNTVPTLHTACTLEAWLARPRDGITLVLDPNASQGFQSLEATHTYTLMIGPEGGFSTAEVERLRAHKCLGVQLGPRILRTETAALAAMTALQSHFGDL